MTGLVSSVDDNNTRSINTDGQLSGSLKKKWRLAPVVRDDLINRTSRGEPGEGEGRGEGGCVWNKWKAIKMNEIIARPRSWRGRYRGNVYARTTKQQLTRTSRTLMDHAPPFRETGTDRIFHSGEPCSLARMWFRISYINNQYQVEINPLPSSSLMR